MLPMETIIGEWERLLRIAPLREQSTSSGPVGTPMKIDPTTDPNNINASNSNSGNPSWYPQEYPEWFISQTCLQVIWGMMTGETLTPVDEIVASKFRASVDDIVFGGAEPTPDLIRDMVEAANPGATEECVRLFIRGIVETTAIRQSWDIPKNARFVLEYPEFQNRANWNSSVEAKEVFKTYMDLLLASMQAEAMPKEMPGTDL